MTNHAKAAADRITCGTMPLIERLMGAEDEPTADACYGEWFAAVEAVLRDAIDTANADLKAIVDKLPKTVDGVPVVAGEDLVWAVRDRPSHPAGPIFETDVFVTYNDSLERDHVTIHEVHRRCYSTREAAEAAQEQGT